MNRIALLFTLALAWPCVAQPTSKVDNEPWPDLSKEVPKEPKPLDPKIIDEWKKAGFKSGWQTAYQTFDYVPNFKHHPEMLPYFSVRPYPTGVLPKLPTPNEPFSLTLYGSDFKDASLKELASHKKLRKLTLSGNVDLSGKGFSHLAELPDLQIISVYQSGLTDDGLKEICQIKSLRELDVGVTSVTEASLPELVRLKRLQVLGVHYVRLTDRGMAALGQCQNLRQLTMSNLKQTGAGFEAMSKLKYLERLQMTGVSGISLKDADLKGLGSLQTLQWLSLYGNGELGDGVADELEKLSKLKHLNLANTVITSGSLKKLANITDLEHLIIDGTKVADEHLSELAKLKNLKALEIRAIGVTEQGLKTILQLENPNLASVKVSGKISKAALEEARKQRPKWLISY